MGFEDLANIGMAVVRDGREGVDDPDSIGGIVVRSVVAEAKEGAIGEVNLREIRPWVPAVPSHSLSLDINFTGPVKPGRLPAQREAFLGAA